MLESGLFSRVGYDGEITIKSNLTSENIRIHCGWEWHQQHFPPLCDVRHFDVKKQEVLHYYFNPENLLLVSEKINHDLEKTQKHGKIPLLDLESISDSGRLYFLPNLNKNLFLMRLLY